jgi:hypothetical protein
MESTAFAAFCNKTGVHGAVVCATLLVRALFQDFGLLQRLRLTYLAYEQNRMEGDQVKAEPAVLKGYAEGAIRVVLAWIKKHVIEA